MCVGTLSHLVDRPTLELRVAILLEPVGEVQAVAQPTPTTGGDELSQHVARTVPPAAVRDALLIAPRYRCSCCIVWAGWWWLLG